MAFPIAELRIYDPRDFFGAVDYEGQHVTWDLLALLGTPGAAFSGFCPDPTGTCLMLQPRHLPLDAGKAQWTPNAGNQAAYSEAKDTTTETLFLRCAPTVAAPAFDTTLDVARPAEEGFFLSLYRAATAGGTFYVYLSAGRAAGEVGLRLAVEAGLPIRLQASADGDATWTDVDTAALGESESYLTSAGRYLTVDVLSECDPDWSSSADSPFGPPGQVCVTLNGGVTLIYKGDSLAAGAVRIGGQQGQWSAAYSRKLFAPEAAALLPPQAREAVFRGSPDSFVSGYQPVAGMSTAEIQADGNQAAAAFAVQMPADGLVTAGGVSYALRSCFLSAVEANWPPVQATPNPAAAFVAYEPVYAVCEPHLDQGTRTVRRRAVCIFQAQDDSYAPGVVIPAARAAVLLMGDVDDPALTPVLTGWTAIAALNGQEWQWVDWQKHFAVIVEGRLRKGDGDQTPCLHMEPFDFQPHYLPVRKLLYRLGITDDWMDFPNVDRDGLLPDGTVFGGYYLGGGQAKEPLWQPAPDDSVNGFLQKVLDVAGEEDPSSLQIQPMILAEDPDGNIDYDPLPAGIASAFLTPGQSLAVLGLTPERDFALNDFKAGTLSTSATLSHIRTPVVLEGLDKNGNVLVGVAANEALGGGPLADPRRFGSVGTNVAYVNISRRFSSPEVIARAVAVAAVTMAFPSIGAVGTLGYLDPALDVLTVITITDPYTQGTQNSVAYWTNSCRHVVDARDVTHRIGETSFVARLLGQAD